MRNFFVWATVSLLTVTAGCPPAREPGAKPRAPSATSERIAKPPPAVTFSLCCQGLPVADMWKCDPVFADVNEDGKLDLAALTRLGSGPHVWLGNGRGDWTDSSAGLSLGRPWCGGGLSFGDVNGDGNLDLAVANHCEGVFVYLGNGKGCWEVATQSLHPTDLAPNDPEKLEEYRGAEDIDAGDVNGDGFADLVVGASYKGGINLYLGDGTGASWKRVEAGLPTTDWANRVLLADMNGDQRLDVVAACGAGPRVWLNEGSGTFRDSSEGLPSPTMGGLYTGIAVGDINRDGRPDIAAANWVDGPEVYLQQGDGSWHKTPDVFPAMRGGAIGLALGDIDGDGNLDIVTSGRLTADRGYTRGVFALRGDGAGGWEWVSDCGLPETGLSGTQGVAMADVNGDGVLDVAATTGLLVETVPGGPSEPALPWRVLVWCGHRGPGAPTGATRTGATP